MFSLYRDPCRFSQGWKAEYVMVDLVTQWLNWVISMEIHLKVCCNEYFIT